MSATRLLTSTTVGAGGFITGALGANIAAATTIAPTDFSHVITGTGTIQTITAPITTPHILALNSQDGFTIATGGNLVCRFGQIAAGRTLLLYYDGTNYHDDNPNPMPAYEVYADWYGADNTGATDSAAAINAAIAALPASGGIVRLSPGIYRIESTITIGDGTSSSTSTKTGVRLIGAGASQSAEQVSAQYTGATVIKWYGASGGTMIKILGPGGGYQLEGFQCDGDPTATANSGLGTGTGAAYCIDIYHAFGSIFRDLRCMRWGTLAYRIAAYSNSATFTYPNRCSTGANQNIWEHVIAISTGGASADGIQVGSSAYGPSGSLNVAQNLFANCLFDIGSSTGKGIVLRYCDNNTFIQSIGSVLVKPASGAGGVNAYPQNNTFLNHGGWNFSLDESDNTWAPTTGNYVLPLNIGDSISAPPTFVGMSGVTSKGQAFGRLNGTVPKINLSSSAAISNTVTPTNFDTIVNQLPANLLRTGMIIRFSAAGRLKVKGAGDTLTVTHYLTAAAAGTTFSGILKPAASYVQWVLQGEYIIRNASTISSVTVQRGASLSTFMGGTYDAVVPTLVGTFTVDNSTVSNMPIQVTWGSADANNSIILDSYFYEILNPATSA